MTDSTYGQGAIDILGILGIDYECAVGDLMSKLLLTQNEANAEISDIRAKLTKVIQEHENRLEIINEVCSSQVISVKCRSCDNNYVIDYDISEYDPDQSYCGRSEWCTP